MRFRVLGLVIASVKLALGAALLFIGSHLLYWGAFGIVFRVHAISWLIPWMLAGGFFSVLPGIYVAFNSGKVLRGRYLALVSLLYLTVALSLIYWIIPPQEPEHWWSWFWTLLPPIILSIAILSVALLIGHSRREIVKNTL